MRLSVAPHCFTRFAEDDTSDRMTCSAHGLHPKGRQSDLVARDVVAADDATHIGMLDTLWGREIRRPVQGMKPPKRFMVSHRRKRSRFDIERPPLAAHSPVGSFVPAKWAVRALSR